MSRLLVAALTSTLVLTPAASSATDDRAAHFVAQPGTVECWDGDTTLWHFIVRNDGTKSGKYRVEYKRSNAEEPKSYTRKVPKQQGVNDGLIIQPDQTIEYVKVTAPAQGGSPIFLRFNVVPPARCSK